HYFPLHDFYAYLANPRIKDANALRAMWDEELKFASMAEAGVAQRYPNWQVYVDIMPVFITAVSKVGHWLDAIRFQPTGSDGSTYFEHFREFDMDLELGY